MEHKSNNNSQSCMGIQLHAAFWSCTSKLLSKFYCKAPSYGTILVIGGGDGYLILFQPMSIVYKKRRYSSYSNRTLISTCRKKLRMSVITQKSNSKSKFENAQFSQWVHVFLQHCSALQKVQTSNEEAIIDKMGLDEECKKYTETNAVNSKVLD